MRGGDGTAATKAVSIADELRLPAPPPSGMSLPDGWRCTVKVRLSQRRHGRIGRTTTNTYRCPRGGYYRSTKDVLAALRGGDGATNPASDAEPLTSDADAGNSQPSGGGPASDEDGSASKRARPC